MIARYIARYEQLVARERTECAEVS
jgi:hypothetical protein